MKRWTALASLRDGDFRFPKPWRGGKPVVEIVKCQRSMFPSGQILWYNKSRSRVYHHDGAHKVWDKLFGPAWDTSRQANLFYAEVRWTNPEEPPQFIKKVEEENW